MQASEVNDGKPKDNTQPVKTSEVNAESVQNLKDANDNPGPITHAVKTSNVTACDDTAEPVKTSENTNDNPNDTKQPVNTSNDAMEPVKKFKNTDDNPRDNTQPVKSCNDTMDAVNNPENKDANSKDNGQLTSQDTVDLTSPRKDDHDTESEESDIELGLLISDDDIELLKNLNEANKVKLYDTVNKVNNFLGYQPTSPSEILVDIVINSVALMRSLKLQEKLSDQDVEAVEELIREIRMEETQQEWIKRGRGGGGGVVDKVEAMRSGNTDGHGKSTANVVQDQMTAKHGHDVATSYITKKS